MEPHNNSQLNGMALAQQVPKHCIIKILMMWPLSSPQYLDAMEPYNPPTPADSRESASEKRGQEGQGKRLAARTSGARAKRQEKEISDEKRKQQVRVAVVRPRFWRLEGCNLELVSCRFRKRR